MIEYKGKQVTIMACSDCNANCEHCYISYKGNLSGDELLDMCKNFKNKYKIIINGTEVLLHKEYFEALKLSDQKRLLTNGLIICYDETILDRIIKTGIKNIAMSYHFGSEVSNVPQNIVEMAIKKIKEKKLNPELMCTITTENYDKLDEICKKVINLDVKTIRFFNCIDTGKCESNCLNLCLNDSQIKTFFKELKKVRKKYDKNILKIKRNGLFGNDISNINCNFKCIAGIDEVVITPDKNVYPCIFMTKPGYEIGKYVDEKIMLYNNINNDGTKCIACEIFNKNNNNIFNDIFNKNDD